jgi:Tol biopolymer transport system component
VRQTIRSASLGWCTPSHDASWLACTSRTGQEDIVLLRADGSETRRLTDDEVKDRIPVWSPDDKTIVFLSRRSGEWNLWSIGVDGAGLHQVTTNAPGVAWGAFSPDSRRIAFPAYSRTSFGFRFADAAQTAAATLPVTPAATRMNVDSWSSDGTLLAGTQGDGTGNPLRLIVWDLSGHRLHLQINLPLQRSSSLGAAFVPGTHDVLVNTTEGVTLVNGDTGTWRVIQRMAPPIETRISGDGRTLLIERPGIEEDLWLMEFKR